MDLGWLLVAALALAWVVAPFIALYRTGRLRRDLNALQARLGALESAGPPRVRPARGTHAGVGPEVAAVALSPSEIHPPPAVPFKTPADVWGVAPGGATAAAPSGAAETRPLPTATSAAASSGSGFADVPTPPREPTWAHPPVAASTRPPAEAERLEDLVGSVWLQNAGAVALLLGVFFFILWGYSTGRFGPGVLVAAGIGIGLASAWRGDRLARSLPRLGHTLIGIGLGVVYLSLYLGHFTLHVLSLPVAFGSLLLASSLAIGAGLRYRVQAIAAIGVVGAFLPQLLASWLPLQGFSLEPAALLGYLAAVDVLVFALAARAGWSTLDLSALVLTALTWSLTYPDGAWSWSVTLALAALFTGLGLAPLPRLVAHDGRVKGIDLAVVAGGPAGLIASLWAWLVATPSVPVAQLLLSLGALQLLAAVWVDSRRHERDLWRPLTGAATVFLTVGLQRLVGAENLGVVWCVEGVLLVVLGRGPRGGWLRFCGHVVTTLAVTVALVDAAWRHSAVVGVPFVRPEAVREFTIVAALLAGAALLVRGREHLGPLERRAPELWTAMANALLLAWSWRECDALANALAAPSGRWGRGIALPGLYTSERKEHVFYAVVGLAWSAQAATLAWLGTRSGRGFLRFCAYVAAVLALAVASWGLLVVDGWSSDQWPVFYPAGWCGLGSLALAALVMGRFASRRGELPHAERYAPEACTAGFLLLLLAWSAREADHVARALLGAPGASFPTGNSGPAESFERVRTLGAALTSAAWMLEAIVLLALGWLRSAAFLRWAGLALIGATIIKFAFYDLASADVFWRFLTAIVTGVAMLAVSYAYQRRAKRDRGAG